MKRLILKVLLVLSAVPFLFTGCSGTLLKQSPGQQQEIPAGDQTEISVTADDIRKYKETVGSDLDTKKAVIILFNTPEECTDFIQQHGNDENVLNLGIGVVPEIAAKEFISQQIQ